MGMAAWARSVLLDAARRKVLSLGRAGKVKRV
jgi:hypothetical protein